MPLTKRQREILDYLAGYIDEHGYAPSFEEIADTMGCMRFTSRWCLVPNTFFKTESSTAAI